MQDKLLTGTILIGGKEFRWGERTYVVGVINVTPDSFSGDGLRRDVGAAVEQSLRFQEDGADIIDVGGESTRPPGRVYGDGADVVSVEEELARVIPVIRRLSRVLTIPISIDTYKSEVARKAVSEGARMVNDVWGLQADTAMASTVAELDVPVVLMHNQRGTHYKDLIPDIMGGLRARVGVAMKAGVSGEKVIIDPGIGFGKDAQQNLEILRRLDEFRGLGYPLMVGSSRKSTIGLVLGFQPDQRVEGTAATVALAVAKGVDIVRVHDVKEMARVVRMADAIVRGWKGAS